MKKCTKCGALKSLDEFYSGAAECKSCRKLRSAAYYERTKERQKEYAKAWRKDNAEHVYKVNKARRKANPDKHRESMRKSYAKHASKRLSDIKNWQKENRDRINEAQRKNYHSIKGQAQRAVKYALKRGEIKKLPCTICGAQKVEAHHEDYTKPLEVTWLCKKHHRERHRKPL